MFAGGGVQAQTITVGERVNAVVEGGEIAQRFQCPFPQGPAGVNIGGVKPIADLDKHPPAGDARPRAGAGIRQCSRVGAGEPRRVALNPWNRPVQPAAATSATQRAASSAPATAVRTTASTGTVAKTAPLPAGGFVGGIRSNVLTSLNKARDNAKNTDQVTPGAPVVTNAPPAAPAAVQTVAVPPPAPKVKDRPKVHWPALRVSAVIAHANPELGRALINERMTRVGDEIDGVQLVGVTGSGVYVAAQDQTNFIRVGRTSVP